MAMQYGQDMVGRGQEELKKNLDKYVSIGQLKYYFAVDTNYVGRKIGKTFQTFFMNCGFFLKGCAGPIAFPTRGACCCGLGIAPGAYWDGPAREM